VVPCVDLPRYGQRSFAYAAPRNNNNIELELIVWEITVPCVNFLNVLRQTFYLIRKL